MSLGNDGLFAFTMAARVFDIFVHSSFFFFHTRGSESYSNALKGELVALISEADCNGKRHST